jgi:drug/metabolite transporter (DMT)-like permease
MLRNQIVLGLAAGFASALIGAAWQLATRYGVTTSLLPSDLALLRYGMPALLLSPLLVKHGVLPQNVQRGWLALMIGGGGIVYGWFAMNGARYSPAAHMGVLLSGTMPLFTALLFFVINREAIERRRLFGYALVLFGVLAFGFASSRLSLADAWLGDILFLCASFTWALYTYAFRKVSLSPWYATALICFWSSLAALGWMTWAGQSRLFDAPMRELALQVLLQGIVAGLVGSFVYAYCVRKLGANNAAIFGAWVPVLSALGGYLFLSETLSVYAAITIAIVVVGILLANDRRAR